MSEEAGAEWRVSEERDLGALVVRLEIRNEPTKNAVGRSLGRLLFDFLLDGFGADTDEPSYSASRVVKVWADRPSDPELLDYGRDYETARLAFAQLVAEVESG